MNPELRNVKSAELLERFEAIGFEYFEETEFKVGTLMRLTLPFALILIIFMFLFRPIKFMITGKWDYTSRNSKIFNWFRYLNIF